MTMSEYRNAEMNNLPSILGEAFDYAINSCGILGTNFAALFTTSSVCRRIENNEPLYVNGKSGIEIAREILLETMNKAPDASRLNASARSREYWAGFVLAHYRLYSNALFSDILRAVSYDELIKLYNPLHEADITKFFELLDTRINEKFPETKLKRFRSAYGCSQQELADRSGVNLRSIQMYEQRKKNINKASVETVHRLAKFFSCQIEDLMEAQ